MRTSIFKMRTFVNAVLALALALTVSIIVYDRFKEGKQTKVQEAKTPEVVELPGTNYVSLLRLAWCRYTDAAYYRVYCNSRRGINAARVTSVVEETNRWYEFKCLSGIIYDDFTVTYIDTNNVETRLFVVDMK